MPRKPAAESRDLRRQILDTAKILLDSEGLAGLSLREVARRSGVTHQAPYHHFKDREAILAAVIAEGFTALAERLESALANSNASPETALVESCVAYVGFALDHPGVFRVMFRPDLCQMNHYPEAEAAGGRAYQCLLDLVARVYGEAGAAVEVSLIWAQVQGLSSLLIDGPLAHQLPDRAAQMAHVRAVATEFAEGRNP